MVILDSVERIESILRDDRELRLAMLSTGNIEPEALFDEFKQFETDEDEIDDGVDEDGNAVSTRYDFSNVELEKTPEEVEREIAQMLASAASGKVTFDDDHNYDGQWL